MVLFRRKEQADRRELLASMDQMTLGKPVDNGKLIRLHLPSPIIAVKNIYLVIIQLIIILQHAFCSIYLHKINILEYG